MRITRILTTVLVQDMDRALRFYRDILGLSLESEEEDWAVFSEGVSLMLSPEPLPEVNLNLNAVSLALQVDDLRVAFHELIERGVAFLVPPTEAAGILVATFRDTEGNILQLIQSE